MSTWPSLVKAYVAGIHNEFDARASIETPPNLHELDRFVRVTLGPGEDDTIFDSSLVDFDIFAKSYGEAEQFAGDIREWVLSTQNRVIGDTHIGRVRTATSPTLVDWGNQAVARFVYSARVSTRRQ